MAAKWSQWRGSGTDSHRRVNLHSAHPRENAVRAWVGECASPVSPLTAAYSEVSEVGASLMQNLLSRIRENNQNLVKKISDVYAAHTNNRTTIDTTYNIVNHNVGNVLQNCMNRNVFRIQNVTFNFNADRRPAIVLAKANTGLILEGMLTLEDYNPKQAPWALGIVLPPPFRRPAPTTW